MGFQDVTLLPSRANFYTTFLIIAVRVIASGQPHVLKLDSKGNALCRIFFVPAMTLFVSVEFIVGHPTVGGVSGHP